MKNKSLQKMVFLGLVLCMVISLVIYGCEPAPTAPTTTTKTPTGTTIKTGGVVKYSYYRDGTVIGYPPKWSSPVEYSIYPCAIENLAYFDKTGNVVPGLATSWKADYATKSITVELRKGVKFHDDTDFNAAAAKWNIDQYVLNKRTDIVISSVDIIDDYNIRVKLPSWDSDCVWKLMYYAGAMISPTAFQKAGTDDKTRQEWAMKNPVGTGPFIFVSKQQDVKTVFKKNPNYWQQGKPYVDGIEWIIIADPIVQIASLKAGDIDAICDIAPKDAKAMKDAGYNIKTAPSMGGVFLPWGDSLHESSPFNKIEVRRAIGYAINSQAIANSLYYGFAQVTNQWASPGTIEYNPSVKGQPYDPAKAKALLTEAGYGNGLSATMFLPNVAVQVDACTAIQANLKVVGIDLKLEIMDEARRQAVSYTAGWSNGMNFAAPRGWGSLSQMRRFLHSTKGNYPGHTLTTIHPPIIDELLDKAFEASDDATKQKYLWDLQKVVFDDYTLMSALYVVQPVTVESTKVKNSGFFEIYAGQFIPPTNMWIDK